MAVAISTGVITTTGGPVRVDRSLIFYRLEAALTERGASVGNLSFVLVAPALPVFPVSTDTSSDTSSDSPPLGVEAAEVSRLSPEFHQRVAQFAQRRKGFPDVKPILTAGIKSFAEMMLTGEYRPAAFLDKAERYSLGIEVRISNHERMLVTFTRTGHTEIFVFDESTRQSAVLSAGNYEQMIHAVAEHLSQAGSR